MATGAWTLTQLKSPMDLLLDLHITDTLCHCGGVFSAVVKWKRLSPSQPESVLVSLRL